METGATGAEGRRGYIGSPGESRQVADDADRIRRYPEHAPTGIEWELQPFGECPLCVSGPLPPCVTPGQESQNRVGEGSSTTEFSA